MKNYSILLFTLSVFTLVVFSSCQPKDLLQETKDKFFTSNYISYQETALFPIPDTDMVNTMKAKVEILFDENDSVGYQFSKVDETSARIYQDDMLRVVNNEAKMIRVYQPKHFQNKEQFTAAMSNRLVYKKWSPLGLLIHEWEFVGDTIIENSKFKNYYRIARETEVEGKKIRTEQHIFISKEALLERFERRNYNDGKLSQQLTFHFTDYVIDKEKTSLSYIVPNGYISTYGSPKKVAPLKEGDIAPDFAAVTMEKDSINMAMFKGKKVLLNFSVINCGSCKQSLDYINQEDFTLSKDIPIFYIDAEDDHARLVQYQKSMNVPFSIIASAEDIAKQYKVNSYPRFFLVNEEGIIEKIQIGFSKEFLDEFRQ